MPSMKWIKEKANAFLDCICPRDAKDRLALAKYNQEADTVCELVSWLETYDRMDRMAKNMEKEKNNG